MKDKTLNQILEGGNNIAQYISFAPSQAEPNFINIKNKKEFYVDRREIILDLLEKSNSNSINIRSFSPTQMKGNKVIFEKRKEDLSEILNIVQENQNNGFYSILNENIDISDGGVSGVLLNGVMEFSPNDTPKCVEKPNVCAVPEEFGNYLFQTIYGFTLNTNYSNSFRVEFSIHPKKQGVLNTHNILWEVEEFEFDSLPNFQNYIWPNRFSQFIGDKAFGLLVADYLGFSVPHTIVLCRNIPPFIFGSKTGLQEKWIRTCPTNKVPGKYYSADSWTDPFILLAKEDPASIDGEFNIASVLSQDAVNPVYSGASIISMNADDDIIEGVEQKGDLFMLGQEAPIDLPTEIIEEVQQIHAQFRKHIHVLGTISIEWVFDGEKVWVVQLNQVKQKSYSNIVVSGTPSTYLQFQVSNGLEGLRELIKSIKGSDVGVELIGNVGITSHFGDLLRQANIPSKITKEFASDI